MRILFFVYLSFAMSIISLAAQTDHIKLCHLEWGKQTGKHLPDQGFNPDLFARVLADAGYTSELKIMPWKRCLLHVEKGSYDMVAGLWIDDDYTKIYEFFNPVTIDEISFMSLSDLDVQSGKLKDFHGKTIGILRGAGGMDMIKNGDFKVKVLTNDDQMVENLKYKRVDAVVSNTAHLNSVIADRYPELIDKIKVWKPAIQSNLAAPAISIHHPKKEELKKRFNVSLRKLQKEGLYEELFKKHGIQLKYKIYE